MTVIHMTQHVYDRFKCEELLDIFKDYSSRRQILIDAEIKKKQDEYQAKEAARKALEAKAYQPTKSFSGNFKTIASVKNASSYGLLDEGAGAGGSIDYNFDYNPPAFSRSNYQENKKRTWGGASKAGGAKKARWGSGSTDSPAGGASAGGGWRGKKRNFKSKFTKFKKKS